MTSVLVAAASAIWYCSASSVPGVAPEPQVYNVQTAVWVSQNWKSETIAKPCKTMSLLSKPGNPWKSNSFASFSAYNWHRMWTVVGYPYPHGSLDPPVTTMPHLCPLDSSSIKAPLWLVVHLCIPTTAKLGPPWAFPELKRCASRPNPKCWALCSQIFRANIDLTKGTGLDPKFRSKVFV